MARFKPGQEVVCVMDAWFAKGVDLGKFGPKKDELVTIRKYMTETHVWICGYEFFHDGSVAVFKETGFEPVVPQEEIEKLLEESKITV